MRGSFDFETYGWDVTKGQAFEKIKPLCCGIMWGVPGERKKLFIHDEKRAKPDNIPVLVLLEMWKRREQVNEWWAHNMGRFDGLFLCAAATRLGWKIEGRLADSRVIMLTFTPPREYRRIKLFDSHNMVPDAKKEQPYVDMPTIRLMDTYNVVPMSLKSCAIDFELPSQKLFNETDYKGDMRDLPVEKLQAGCLADCEIVLELLERLEEQVDQWNGKLKKTFSSSALSIVKQNLEERGMQLPDFSKPNDTWINDTAGQGYYGGRVEVFLHAPTTLLTSYDVCSSYPYAMAQPLPWRFKAKLKGGKLLQAYEEDKHLMVRAKVKVAPQAIPPLPYKQAQDEGSIFFPTGTWEAWFAADELRYAETQGTEVELVEGLEYDTEDPFSDFIGRVYQLKKTSKGAVRTFAKLLLNGCYGKFAESPEHEKLKVMASQEEGLEYILNSEGEVGCAWDDERYLSVKYHSPARHAHYAIASHITARARILLHRYLLESSSPAYCDSDSIHCLRWPGQPGDCLGELKIEHEGYRGEFFAPKIYRMTFPDGTTKLACKGFPVNDKDFAAMYGSAVDLHRWKQTHSKSMPNRKELAHFRSVKVTRTRLLKSQFKERSNIVIRRETEKRWSGLSMKRKPFADGSTEAWTVNELKKGLHKEAVCPLIKLNKGK